MIRYYICHFFYRYLARFFPLYHRLDPKWKQIIGYISKDMQRYCDGSRIVQVYDLRTKCEEAISKSVNVKERVQALISCGYPVWYTDSTWLTLLRKFPPIERFPGCIARRSRCPDRPIVILLRQNVYHRPRPAARFIAPPG